ncbi:MAG: hypothetical protein MUC49_02730 [Raineya sp.]|jgi:hypothetical protein|nr:hypothetical protein [Raineya sp.]
MKTFFNILVIVMLGLYSCKKNEPSFSFNENLKVKISEGVEDAQRIFLLNFITEKIYECSNYRILTTQVITNDKIVINFIQIEKPEICLNSLGAASTTIKLQGLENKSYTLELNFGSSKILGVLKVSATDFEIELPNQTKVQKAN